MRFLTTFLWSLLLFSVPHAILSGGKSGAQPCGTGTLYLYVIDSDGRPVENLTVEVLKPGSREPFYECREGYCPGKQSARGPQSEFLLPTPAGGGTTREVTLRYTAPGYLTYEETGSYLMGCQAWHGAVLMRDFETTLAGARPPSLAGVVREFFYVNAEQDTRHRIPGRPLPGVAVVAERDGKQFRAVTDASGRYKFDTLPAGVYVVYPRLPKSLASYDTNGFALDGVRTPVVVNTGIRRYGLGNESPQRHVRASGGGGLAVSVGDGESAARADFLALPSGSISGRIVAVPEGATGNAFEHYLKLCRVNPQTKEVEPVPVRGAYAEPLPSAPGEPRAYGFTFHQVPAGKYVIEMLVFTSPMSRFFYYPGVDSAAKAKVLNFREGEALSGLVIKFRSLTVR